MLVLTRKLNESILIGDGIEVKIVQIKGTGDNAVIRLGISAPREVSILRKEIFREVAAENQSASKAPDQAALKDLVKELGAIQRPPGPARGS